MLDHLRFFGDSHIDILASRTHNRWPNTGLVFTLERLRSWLTQYRDLDAWLAESRAQQVVISAGNTDIRAHWWRRSITQGYSEIDQYVLDQARLFLSVCLQLVSRYELAGLIILGVPVCSDHVWDGHYPFSGSVETRNRMADLWSRHIVNWVRTNPCSRISYATAFYHYINPLTYRADPAVMDDDGVHYRWSEREFIIEQVIKPCALGQQSVSMPNRELFDSWHSRRYTIEWTSWLESKRGYWDSWIFSESAQISETYARRSTDPNARDYSLEHTLPRPQRSWGRLRAQYLFFDEFDRVTDLVPYKELELRG